jgi:hypothetical protein
MVSHTSRWVNMASAVITRPASGSTPSNCNAALCSLVVRAASNCPTTAACSVA